MAHKTANLVISDASIQDQTQAAQILVTQNSAAGFDYEKYLCWFLAHNLSEPAKPEFADLASAQITAARTETLA